MNIYTTTFYLGLTLLLATATVQAHDPSEHSANSETPNCSAMHETGHTTTDMDDPIQQAIMKQCMNQMHAGKHPKSEGSQQEKVDDDNAATHNEAGQQSDHH